MGPCCAMERLYVATADHEQKREKVLIVLCDPRTQLVEHLCKNVG